MNRIDLHVDELFDGARIGSLSTLEAARLQALPRQRQGNQPVACLQLREAGRHPGDMEQEARENRGPGRVVAKFEAGDQV